MGLCMALPVRRAQVAIRGPPKWWATDKSWHVSQVKMCVSNSEVCDTNNHEHVCCTMVHACRVFAGRCRGHYIMCSRVTVSRHPRQPRRPAGVVCACPELPGRARALGLRGRRRGRFLPVQVLLCTVPPQQLPHRNLHLFVQCHHLPFDRALTGYAGCPPLPPPAAAGYGTSRGRGWGGTGAGMETASG